MALYYNIMKVDPPTRAGKNGTASCSVRAMPAPRCMPFWRTRGISRGGPLTLRKFHSHLQGHPDMRKTPGVDANTGSLGQGVSIAGGMALAAKYKGESHRVFVITGDGESQEGLVWRPPCPPPTISWTTLPFC